MAEVQLAAIQQEQDRLGAIQELKMRAAAVEAAKARLEKAKTALDPSPAEVAIAREQIRREQATGTVRIATLKRERESLIQQQIELEQQGDRQCTLQAGMEGRADILAHRETVLQFILRRARLISSL
ncbi:hypothetical protein [Spirulina sp. 06S082]|uniref:hypothetical protein n=1 Tax=Spirulina sp. 06S082 TaxID=3110248 RepID=UPI002B21D9C0|nr:hypothetical protein [Spirulina sp. 06S082]MEA5471895.1 hypothetical protein [Spirulina sp. 06S082]